MRVSHFIKDNKTSSMPTEFIFFDTETTPKVNIDGDIEQPFKLGVALYWRRRKDRGTDVLTYYRFKNIAKFWDFVNKHTLPKHRLILVAHNLQFDFMVLGGFSYLRLLGFDLTNLITNGKVNIFTYRRDTRTILCLDNMNYFNTSLKTLGDSVGLEKLDMPKGVQSVKTWYEYCQRDVDIMYHAWREWLSFLYDQDLGTFGKTLPSQAFNAYRHRFMSHNILIGINRPATELERASYRGGRVECFQLGKLPDQNYYLYDINSMYPYCMKHYSYPVKLKYLKVNPSLSFLDRVLKKRCVIGDVLIKTDSPAYGVRHQNRLIFPVGTFRVTLTSAELKRAISRGEIQCIFKIAVYTSESIFGSFVDYFYNQRLAFKDNGNATYSYLCKIMLNSLYGKFGQRNEEWEYIKTEPDPIDYIEREIDAQTGKIYIVRCIKGQVFETRNKVEGYNSFPAISSEVTGNARVMLWEFIEQAGRDNVFYCDTDSLIVNSSGSQAICEAVHKTELGKLKLVQTSKSITLHNVKDYVVGKQVKIKGISRTAKKVSDDEYITYQQQGIRAALHNGKLDTMTWRRVPKKLSRRYDKAIVLHDQTIYPLIMMYSVDENWLDYDAMLDQYGKNACFRGKWLEEYMKMRGEKTLTTDDYFVDHTPADQLAIQGDDVEQRRAGEMIYQR